MKPAREEKRNKSQKLREREFPKLRAQGWTCDEEHDQLIPPGWVRAEPMEGKDVTN